MEKEEQYILDKCGKQNPFRVPDGYFDNLRAELMKHSVVKPKEISLWQRYRRYAAAACTLLVVGGLSAYFGLSAMDTPDNATVATADNVTVQSEYEEYDYADYSMLDNDDIYSILASN